MQRTNCSNFNCSHFVCKSRNVLTHYITRLYETLRQLQFSWQTKHVRFDRLLLESSKSAWRRLFCIQLVLLWLIIFHQKLFILLLWCWKSEKASQQLTEVCCLSIGFQFPAIIGNYWCTAGWHTIQIGLQFGYLHTYFIIDDRCICCSASSADCALVLHNFVFIDVNICALCVKINVECAQLAFTWLKVIHSYRL